jgi:ABC-type sugar transport system substrate-binding protein
MTNASSLRAGGGRTNKPRRSLGRLTALGVVAALALAACGSGDSDTDTATGAAVDVATYQAGAEKAMAAVTKFTGPTEGPKAQSGKKVMFLACGFEAEGCNLPAKAAKEAGDALGWDTTLVDGKFDPRIFSRAIQEAIDDKVDGIIIDAISVEAIAEPIKRARAAGIVVGSYDSANAPSKDGVSYEVIADPQAQGKAMSDYMIWKTDGKARPFMLDAPEFKGPSTWLNAARKGFEDCTSCKVVDAQNFVAGDVATRLPQLSLSTARQNPDMNALVASYDAAMLQTIPSLEQAGLLKNIKVGTFNGVSPALQFVRDGKLAATVGGAMAWGAWAAMDNMNRVLAGEEAVEQNVPIRLITSENIDTIAPGGPWDGDVDFRAAYKNIWSGR